MGSSSTPAGGETASSGSSVGVVELGAPTVALPSADASLIVIVDDEPSVRRAMGRLLEREGYPVREYGSGEAALSTLEKEDVALLITDISMPGMSGVELAQRAFEEQPDLAVIVFTGVPDSVTAVKSLRLGVSDYLTKPIELQELRETVERTLHRRAQAVHRRRMEVWLRQAVEARTRQLEERNVSTLVALVRAMEAKDPFLKGGSERVAHLCWRMGELLGLDADAIEAVRVAGLLHDIGLIGVSEAILHKSGSLTEDEWRQIRSHVEVGVEILSPLEHLGDVIDFVRSHHERLNGSGYPKGLRGDEIPLGAQIVGLADSFSALTADRAFRAACSAAESLETLRATAGVWYRPALLDALEQAVAEGVGSR